MPVEMDPYMVAVTIESAHNPGILVDHSTPLRYEQFVFVSKKYDFTVMAASGTEIPITVTTSYDDIENFAFDQSDKSISFKMPFDWSPEHVRQIPLVHKQVHVPNEFAPWNNEVGFRGFVNGIKMGHRNVIVDLCTLKDIYLVHFLLSNNDLRQISEALGDGRHSDGGMNFRPVLPESTSASEPGNGTASIQDGSNATLVDVAEHMPSPLQQAMNVILAGDVECAGSRVLVRSPAELPACVFAASVKILQDRDRIG